MRFCLKFCKGLDEGSSAAKRGKQKKKTLDTMIFEAHSCSKNLLMIMITTFKYCLLMAPMCQALG